MSENSQPVEQSRVESFYVERVFNLGNYENIKYGVRISVGRDEHPGLLLASVERILEDLRASSGVDNYELGRARRILATPEAELDEFDKKRLDQCREFIERDAAAKERRREARKALESLNYTSEHKDHKENWDDDGFDVEF